MEKLETIIAASLSGDPDAYAAIVRRFQDMAVGYAYSILHDFQLAEDAAQEAFFEAYRTLSKLREHAAFPGWFRRIVFKQCDRITRVAKPILVPLDAVAASPNSNNPAGILEESEMNASVREAVELLNEHERVAVLLYYMGGHSQQEVAEFLEAPVTTIKKRLHDARMHLREILMQTVEDDLRSQRPSRTEDFASQVIAFIAAARARDITRIKSMLQQNPRLLAARDPLGNTALVIAMNSGYRELAELVIAAGVEPNLWEAAAIGDVARLQEFLDGDVSRFDEWSPEGFTPMMLAAHFGHADAVTFLLDRGAHIDAISKHPLGVTALHATLFGGHVRIARVLMDRGADVTVARGGAGWPRAGWTALHYAAGFGLVDLIEPLLAHGAKLNAFDASGATPLDVAIQSGRKQIADLLTKGDDQ